MVGIQLADQYKYMVRTVGGEANVGITYVDYTNFLWKKRLKDIGVGDARTPLNYFLRKKSKNSSFFYQIMIDDENQLTNFFWVNANSIVDYYHFGDVIFEWHTVQINMVYHLRHLLE